uniref:Uncharacterized protein n=1 Tax=viral metagenome TaxID=1070528 RepID=A0A6C0B0T5_9ZZZZ
MASGIASPWGLTPPMLAEINKTLDEESHHLTGEFGLSSIPPKFKGNEFVSPLTVRNKGYYSAPSNMDFGKRKNRVRIALKKVNSDINYLKRV